MAVKNTKVEFIEAKPKKQNLLNFLNLQYRERRTKNKKYTVDNHKKTMIFFIAKVFVYLTRSGGAKRVWSFA